MKTELLIVAPGINAIPASLVDAGVLASLVQDNLSYLNAYLPKVTTLATVQACEAHIQYVIDGTSEGSLYEWHLFADERLCGSIRVNHIEEDNHKASMGYYICASHQGKGLATKAVRAVMAYCFGQLGFNRIELQCAGSNVASQKVAARLGFAKEATLRQAEYLNGAFTDLVVFGLLRENFNAQAEADLTEAVQAA